MEITPITTILALALLTAPTIAGGMAADLEPDSPELWLPEDSFRGSSAEDEMGTEVDIHDATAVVTRPGTEHITVLERGPDGWQDTAEFAPDSQGQDFAYSAATNGTTVAVGQRLAPVGSADVAGRVHIYESTAEGWTKTEELTASDPSPVDIFGHAVDIQDDTLVVAAPAADVGDVEDAGAVYVFNHVGDTWTQTAKLTAPTPEEGEILGYTLSVHENTVIAGTWANRAHVFHAVDGSWEHHQALSSQLSTFGFAVDASVSHLGVGAPSDGTVKVYGLEGGGWTEQATLRGHERSPTTNSAEFGSSLSFDATGTDLLVGAPKADRIPGDGAAADLPLPCLGAFVISSCERAGAAYLFEHSGDGSWGQTKLLAPNSTPGEAFGESVALTASGNTSIVGAPGEGAISEEERGSAHLLSRGASVGSTLSR